jgi:CheY-like chemotaxis protein
MAVRYGNVLIVEDDADIRDALRFALEDAGYVVYEAPSGEPAMRLLHESQRHMVVLVDLNMPGMDGKQVLAAIAQHDTLATRHAYIVMTANEKTLPLTFVNLLANLHVPILAKPFDVEQMLEMVHHADQPLESANR